MISTETSASNRCNHRAALQCPQTNPNLPDVTITGTVIFDLITDAAAGTVRLGIRQDPPVTCNETRLVGETPAGDQYIRVPKGNNVRIIFELGGNWQWTFPPTADGITLKSASHSTRYWLTDASCPRSRTVVIQSSHVSPLENVEADDGRFDERFNIEVLINQGRGHALAVEFDPITKNPPPVGG
ncbi:MAG: hypothetical protein J0M19_02990 [Sphingomonadales bacterium]|nr:hypothetical protein [Sphingomonadales bacterium]